MASPMPNNAIIDISAIRAANVAIPAPKANGPRTSGLTGLISGNADFDLLLDRLHVAFGELARADDSRSTAAADAANDLSATYTSITGRSLPSADQSAGLLATMVQQGLASMPTSLTDPSGQRRLRLL